MKEKIKELEEEFSKGLVLFDPDPERENAYFTVYDKNGKILGRSNREIALVKFRANVTTCNYEGAYVVFDGDETKYEISSNGEFAKGYTARYFNKNLFLADYCAYVLKHYIK